MVIWMSFPLTGYYTSVTSSAVCEVSVKWTHSSAVLRSEIIRYVQSQHRFGGSRGAGVSAGVCMEMFLCVLERNH